MNIEPAKLRVVSDKLRAILDDELAGADKLREVQIAALIGTAAWLATQYDLDNFYRHIAMGALESAQAHKDDD